MTEIRAQNLKRFGSLSLLLGAVGYLFTREPPAPAQNGGGSIEIVYSPEKREWMAAAVREFAAIHPEVRLRLTPMGSREAARAILAGTVHPLIWSPSDQMSLELAAMEYEKKHHAELFPTHGEGAPQPLVLTPLVWVTFKDRAEAFAKFERAAAAAPGATAPMPTRVPGGGQGLTWSMLHDGAVAPNGWATIGDDPARGAVKIGHSDPLASNSGMQVLWLASLDYLGNPLHLDAQSLDKPEFLGWLAGLEGAVRQTPASTEQLMNEFLRYGASKYDVVAVYENLVISHLLGNPGAKSNLRVYYPQVTMWSEHPAVVLTATPAPFEAREGAHQFIRFLLGERMQAQAVAMGLRPSDPHVSIDGPGNPFARLAEYGIRREIPGSASSPEPLVAVKMVQVWKDVLRARLPEGRPAHPPAVSSTLP